MDLQNGIADFTFLGGISGFVSNSPNLAAGSANYAYLGGVTPSKSLILSVAQTILMSPVSHSAFAPGVRRELVHLRDKPPGRR